MGQLRSGRLLQMAVFTIFILGCAEQQPRSSKPDVSFRLGEKSVTVDTSEGEYFEGVGVIGGSWTTETNQVIHASGPDSARSYLVSVEVNQGVSFEPGEKPPTDTTMVFVSEGRGSVSTSTYVSQCGETASSGCLDEYRSPENSFDLLAYVEMYPVGSDTTARRVD